MVASTSKPHCGVSHLALAKFGQVHFIDSSLPTTGTDDRLLEVGPHRLLIDSDLSNVAIQFLATLLALEVDLHSVSPKFLADDNDGKVITVVDCYASFHTCSTYGKRTI